MYLSPVGALREALNQSVLRWKRYAAKASGSGALSERLLKLKSAYPRIIQNAAACLDEGAGRITVDAREKE
jgi:hypothetical protein